MISTMAANVTQQAKNNLDIFNQVWARMARAITAGCGVVVALGKFPENAVEWSGMVIALLGGSYTTKTRNGG